MSSKLSAADLVAEYVTLDDFVSSETKRFGEHLKPTKTRMEEIKSILLGMLNEQRANSFNTENGTAYISTILTPKIVDREKYLEFINDNWDTVGNEMLQVSAPQKDSLKNYLDEHGNAAPPGVTIDYLNRVNIRRS